MIQEQTIRIIRAQDLVFQFTMATPQDITGWSITFAVNDSLGGTNRITKTVGSGITITDPGRGVIQVAIAKTDTNSLNIQDYVWGLKRTDAGNNVMLARGELILEQEEIS
jgi:hypothetical protein